MKLGITARWLLILALLIPAISMAADEEKKDGEAAAPKVQYIDMKPPLVVNYGTYGRKSKYLQVKISLRVENENDAIDVSYHQAPLRHNLIMLLSGLPDNAAATQKDIEQIRKDALKVVQQTIEEYAPGVKITDLLFTSFVKQ